MNPFLSVAATCGLFLVTGCKETSSTGGGEMSKGGAEEGQEMSYWIEKTKTHHRWAHQDDGYDLRLGPGRSLSEIEAIEASIGFKFPDDVRAFYQEVDGFGVKHSSSEEIDWFVVPLNNIPATTKKARDWFRETHPVEAERFFAFVDWSSGDYSGYLTSPQGDVVSFVTFSHEEYGFDVGQDSEDFFETVYERFEDLFDTD